MTPGGDGLDDDPVGSAVRGFQHWFLLDGDRVHVAGLTVAGLFAFLAAVSISAVAPLRNLVPLFYVFGGMIAGNLTLVTVVVAFAQLLLSREFTTPEELRSQIESIVDYRRDIETATDRIAPVEPMGFLRLLVEHTRREAQSLGGLAISEIDVAVSDELDPIVSRLTDKADAVDDLLQESDASTFDVLSTTLTTNYAHEMYELRRFQREYDDRLPDDVVDSIDSLVDQLRNIDAARQYFKTIYLQEELATLSRLLLYVGLGSLALVTAGLLAFTASNGASVPRTYLPVFVAVLGTVALAPLSLLLAFVLRIAMVTQRTAATLPFTTPAQQA